MVHSKPEGTILHKQVCKEELTVFHSREEELIGMCLNIVPGHDNGGRLPRATRCISMSAIAWNADISWSCFIRYSFSCCSISRRSVELDTSHEQILLTPFFSIIKQFICLLRTAQLLRSAKKTEKMLFTSLQPITSCKSDQTTLLCKPIAH